MPRATKTPPELVNLHQLAALAGHARTVIVAAVNDGRIHPAAYMLPAGSHGRRPLFSAGDLPEILRQLQLPTVTL